MIQTMGKTTTVYAWATQAPQPAASPVEPPASSAARPAPPAMDPRALRSIEDEVARHTRSLEATEATERSLGATIAGLDTRMADLQHQISDITGDQKSHARWMSATNWVGKGGAAGVVVGLGLINTAAFAGIGLMMGGLAVFCGSYLLQMRARVRSGDLCAEANPLRREYDQCAETKQGLSRQSVEIHLQAVEARSALNKAQGRLDVMRMARNLEATENPCQAGRVEMQEDGVRIGGVLVPRNAPASA